VNGVSFTLDAGRTLAIVGESGSGKTLLARSIMGLVPPALALPAPGRVQFGGQDLRTLKERELARRRGRDIAMVFQDPMTSLNPVLRVGEQITEVLRHHLRLSREGARERALGLLEEVGVPLPEQRLDEYPHQL
ncbi:dipeptide/oligopeptide/nickel ABC transporter ATP-binding protein, partial [Vibrio agarivorans]